MNDSPHEFAPSDEDPLLRELLAPLRHIEPTLDARIAFRQAVADELGRVSQARTAAPWWRRSVSVPLPLAACLLVSAAIVLARGMFPSGETVAGPDQGTGVTVRVAEAKTGPTGLAAARPEANATHRAVETYLCGVGTVSSKTYYRIQEREP